MDNPNKGEIKMQSVCIKMTDGTEGFFVGPKILDIEPKILEGEEKVNTIESVQIVDLPENKMKELMDVMEEKERKEYPIQALMMIKGRQFVFPSPPCVELEGDISEEIENDNSFFSFKFKEFDIEGIGDSTEEAREDFEDKFLFLWDELVSVMNNNIELHRLVKEIKREETDDKDSSY